MAHDQLAQARVRYAMGGAEIIKQRLAAHAEPCLKRALRIIDAGMNHLAVAGAGLHADMAVLFQDDRVMPGKMKGTRHRQAHRTGADDDGFRLELFHGAWFCREIEGAAMLV